MLFAIFADARLLSDDTMPLSPMPCCEMRLCRCALKMHFFRRAERLLRFAVYVTLALILREPMLYAADAAIRARRHYCRFYADIYLFCHAAAILFAASHFSLPRTMRDCYCLRRHCDLSRRCHYAAYRHYSSAR